MTGRIFDITRFAIHDGPGIRTTVFLKGCPLGCRWCQNPEGIDPGEGLWIKEKQCIRCGACVTHCHAGAVSTQPGTTPKINREICDSCWACVKCCPGRALRRIDTELSSEKLIQELLLDRLFYDVSGGGVTLSGGEPLAQPEFTFEILELLKNEGIHTCMETSLFAPEPLILKLKNVLNYLICDIKLIDDEAHRKYTGVSNRIILDNFRRVAGDFPKVLVRVPLIPGITAVEENLKATGEFVRSIGKNIVGQNIEIELLNYNRLCESKYAQLDKPPFSTANFGDTEESATTMNLSFTEESMNLFYSWVSGGSCVDRS